VSECSNRLRTRSTPIKGGLNVRNDFVYSYYEERPVERWEESSEYRFIGNASMYVITDFYFERTISGVALKKV